MKIVIDIPEKYLNSNIIDVTLFTGANNTITDVSVENEYTEFQVLPKGHGRLIDADVLGEKLHRYIEAPYQYALTVFNESPTIIEADKGEERIHKQTTIDDFLKEQLKDPEFKKEWEKLHDEDMKGGEEE